MPHRQIDSYKLRESEPGNPGSTDALAQRVAERLADAGLHATLALLNARVDYRFTGVYRFDGDWVVSVALYDRENPTLTLGANVKMQESYCRIAGELDAGFEIADAPRDPRLDGHAARHAVQSYIAVLLRDSAGRPWGTLCHFDFVPHRLDPAAISDLQSASGAIQQHAASGSGSRWVQPVEPGPGSPRLHPPA